MNTKTQFIIFAAIFTTVLFLQYTVNSSHAQTPQLTRYNIECGLPVQWDPTIIMNQMVDLYGGDTSTWPADDKEFFECLTVVQIQEAAGTGKSNSIFK